ncbi:MAG: 23S rRNA (uracil(1939)-C(5))-methyltransferase RlmD [Bacteroides sp.]
MAYEKNDLVTVTIEDVGMEGEGIGKIDGFPLFIKDAVVGDTVEAKIIKSKKNYAYARVEKVVTPSPFRVEPPCKSHRQCGGCQIQALSYDRQLAFKQDKVRNNLLRIGGFSEAEVDRVMEPVVGMENPLRYRNKAQYPFGTDRQGNPITGFYAGRTHSIISNTECYLGREENREILQTILDYMKEYHVNAYDEETGKGLIRHALIRTGFYTGEIMVCLVINYKGKQESYLPRQDKLLEKLALIKGMTSVSVSINTERTNVIMGKEIHTIWGSDTITDKIRVRNTGKVDMPYTGEELTFSISPLSFYQVNPMQTEKLYSLALEYAGLTGKESVWDLYCGIGTISLFMALRAKEVYGVEIIPQAIDDARQNAVRNHISNAEFFVGKAEEVLPAAYDKEESHPDVIVVDPPRKGCDEKCLDTMLKMAPSRIVYVSCDSATLARDLKLLCAGGYCLERVRPVDQFAHTVHVETVCLLSLKKDTPKIEVTMEPDEKSNYTPEEKATYQKIKEYVKNKYGVNVHTRYIAEVKRMCGLDMGENYNKSKKENPEVKHCPQEKVEYIKDALKYYSVI